MLCRVLLAFVVLTVTACSMPSVTPKTGAPCENAGLRVAQSADRSAHLAAAFVASVADVTSWESHGFGNGSLRIVSSSSSYPGAPLDRVDVCYYSGAFYIGGHPVATAGGTTRPWDLLLVTVDADGHASIRSAGFRETTPLASPPHGP